MRKSIRPNGVSGEVARRAIVIADTFERPFLIGDLAPNTQFLDEIPVHLESSETELYLLNLPLQRAQLLSLNWLECDHTEVNYWIMRNQWELLDGLAESAEGIYIRDVSYNSDWIKLVLVGDSPNTLDKESFYRGLCALGLIKGGERLEFEGASLTEPSFRGLLIGKLIPLAKPIKSFMPKKLIVVVYKILERIK